MPFRILNKHYFCEIILFLEKGPKSFNEIRNQLKLSPNTLSRRLGELKNYGLVNTIVVEVDGENRIKYQLLSKADELLGDFQKFLEIGNKIEGHIEQTN